MNSYVLIYTLALFIRIWIVYSEFQDDIAERIEISTPVNSLYRVVESCYRMDIGVNPYSSDVLHESPVHLYFYKFLIDNTGKYLPLVFIISDMITAFILYLFAKNYMLSLYINQHINRSSYSKDSQNQILAVSDYSAAPIYVTVMYLFNPYIIFNCVGCTTTTFLNLCLALFFYGISCGSVLIGAVSLVFTSIQAFYPIILISPLYLSVLKYHNSKTKAFLSAVLTVLLLCIFLFGSCYMLNSCNFIEHTYGFILGVTDQHPNIGVYWYFFMEMFEHFRQLFIYSYQINVTILYLVPLTIKFRKDPILLSMCFVTLTAIFKSYPSIGDFGFALALLPCWKYMYNCMQQIFISGVAIFITTTLAPILWDLWIYWGTANANFYFGSTLAFITAHIFILTDISFAYTKREYLLKYGNLRTINGKNAKLVLD